MRSRPGKPRQRNTVVPSRFDRKDHDLYETPEWVTEALIRKLPVSLYGQKVWEPASGRYKMAKVLEKAGAIVRASDIVSLDIGIHQYDFLSDEPSPFAEWGDSFAIITNPPYGKANRTAVKFIEAALERCDGWVAMLLTAKFDFGITRTHLFADNRRFYGRIALLDRIQWFPGTEHKASEDHAWFIWAPEPAVPYTPRLMWA